MRRHRAHPVPVYQVLPLLIINDDDNNKNRNHYAIRKRKRGNKLEEKYHQPNPMRFYKKNFPICCVLHDHHRWREQHPTRYMKLRKNILFHLKSTPTRTKMRWRNDHMYCFQEDSYLIDPYVYKNSDRYCNHITITKRDKNLAWHACNIYNNIKSCRFE